MDFDLANPGGKEEKAQPATPQTIQSSAAAYRDLNATLGNFYEQPKNDNAEMDELLERIASLESELESEKSRTPSMDEQVALMEKSYELAAKYMGGQNGGKRNRRQSLPPCRKGKEHGDTRKASDPPSRFLPCTAHEQRGVCRHLLAGTQPGFQHGCRHGRGIGPEHHSGVCAWCAERDGRADGKAAPAGAYGGGGQDIPRNAVVVGTGKIQGERLDIGDHLAGIRWHDYPVELAVYDTDGQPGIFIPNSMEMNAVREVAANMGGSLGSSINISTNAGAQLASDLGKGLIQGTSQYIAKKMRTVKVHLKAGYRVMLYQEKD